MGARARPAGPLRRTGAALDRRRAHGVTAGEVVGYYVRRWQVEVTFGEARRHLGTPPCGVETQRRRSDAAIARATPVLLGLSSVVTLLAARLVRDGRLPVRTAAWYAKPAPTFSDALAAGYAGSYAPTGGAISVSAPHAPRRT